MPPETASRPENSTCREEVQYWARELFSNDSKIEGREKAVKKLRCYAHSCSTRDAGTPIEFSWCCKRSAQDLGTFAEMDVEALRSHVDARYS